jgi:hypothetical protein
MMELPIKTRILSRNQFLSQHFSPTMRHRRFSRPERSMIRAFLLSVTTLLFALSLSAQPLPNFAGKWEFDKTASTPGTVQAKYDGSVTRQIVQNASAFTYRDIYVRTGNSDWKTADESFSLSGKEQIKKDRSGSRRKIARWSRDKQTLTLTYKETYAEEGVSKELLMAESYTLSDEGRTLTIEALSRNQITGETTSTSVFHRK